MADICSLMLECRLTNDAEKKIHGDKEFYVFRVAHTEYYKSETNKKSSFWDCEWWNFNRAVEFLKTGKPVFIFGRISQNTWTDKEGKKQTKTIIKVDKLELRGSSNRSSEPRKDELAIPVAEPDDFLASLENN